MAKDFLEPGRQCAQGVAVDNEALDKLSSRETLDPRFAFPSVKVVVSLDSIDFHVLLCGGEDSGRLICRVDPKYGQRRRVSISTGLSYPEFIAQPCATRTSRRPSSPGQQNCLGRGRDNRSGDGLPALQGTELYWEPAIESIT